MDAAAPPAKDRDRSKQIYVLWGVGFAVLAALGAFCWLVVGPVMEADAAAEELSRSIAHEMLSSPERTAPVIARLGGPEKAARKLGIFLRMPKRVSAPSEKRASAVTLLSYCGKPGLAELIVLLDSRDKEDQALGAHGVMLYSIMNHPTVSPASELLPLPWIDETAPGTDIKSVPSINFTASMETAARDEDPQVREAATKALRIWEAERATMGSKPY
jgi:hypothetical protein